MGPRDEADSARRADDAPRFAVHRREATRNRPKERRMSLSPAVVLSRRSLAPLTALVLALFALSAAIAAIWGRHPDSDAVDAVGVVAWFGFLGGAALLLVLSVASLVIRAWRAGR
jgi:hypothetical protein